MLGTFPWEWFRRYWEQAAATVEILRYTAVGQEKEDRERIDSCWCLDENRRWWDCWKLPDQLNPHSTLADRQCSRFHIEGRMKSEIFGLKNWPQVRYVQRFRTIAVRNGPAICAPTVSELDMRSLVHTRAVVHTIFLSVLSPTGFIVPIIEIFRKTADRAVVEYHLRHNEEPSMAAADDETSIEGSPPYVRRPSSIPSDSWGARGAP